MYQVNTISAHIPGSQSSKITIHNEIRNYFGYFGLPQLFLTFNPSPAHSPLFLVMCGNKTINLFDHFPKIPSAQDRAIALANDPIAAADFFEFSITTLFTYLLGWDYKSCSSSLQGGIFGKVCAFYGITEFTEQGCLHGHFLIWLVGGMNPSELHKALDCDLHFQKRVFAFFEGIIHHELPDIDVHIDPSYDPCIEQPPHIPSALVTTPIDATAVLQGKDGVTPTCESTPVNSNSEDEQHTC